MDQIASTIRVVKREIHAIVDGISSNSNMNSRRQTMRMSTALPSGYRSGLNSVIDDLRDIQDSLADLQMGISRLSIENQNARTIMPQVQPMQHYYNHY
jgi:hypothetical protein